MSIWKKIQSVQKTQELLYEKNVLHKIDNQFIGHWIIFVLC